MADAKKITMLSELPILPDVANFETVGLALTISCSHGKPQISLPCFFKDHKMNCNPSILKDAFFG